MSGTRNVKRCGGVIHVVEEELENYKHLHANVWPEVLDRLEKSNVRNFTIYFCKELMVLFSHFEYVGSNYEEDMQAIADDPKTRDWWKICEPCQKPFNWEGPPPSSGEAISKDWWEPIEEVFHDGLTPQSYKKT